MEELPFIERKFNEWFWTTSAGARVQSRSLENPAIPLTDPDAWNQITGADGVSLDKKTALSITALWNAISLISGHIASFPLGVFKKTNEGSERVKSHPADKLLSREPNQLMTAFDLRRIHILSALCQGNGYVEIKRKEKVIPQSLEFINAEFVKIRISPKGVIFYDIEIKDAEGRIIRQDTIKAENMLHIKGLSLNGITGLNVIDYHNQTLSLGLSQRQLSTDYYNNGAVLQGVIEGAMNADQQKQAASSFKRTHIGLGKQFGTAVLPNGTSYKPIGISPEALQMAKALKMTIEDVARIYNIPLHKLKDLERSTNNNIEHQDLEYYKDCLLPWAISIEQEYNRKLLQESEKDDHFTKHNVSAVLRADTKTRYEAYAIMKQNKLATTNEIREKEDMNKIAGGDELENPNIQVNDTKPEPNNGDTKKALKTTKQ